MKIVILDGDDGLGNGAFAGYLDELAWALEGAGHEVGRLTLRKMDLKPCIGCFNCWLKTPGACVSADDHGAYLRAYVGADLAVFASPLRMGFTTAVLKTATDKILPILLPYISGASGECRHYLRYGRSVRVGLVYMPEADTDAEDVELLEGMWRRFARNGSTALAFACSTERPVKEVVDALDHI